MDDEGYLLSDLADRSGVEARTIRSWVSNGVVPGPSRMGSGARYPAKALDHVKAVSAMRDVHRMPMADVRREILHADPAKVLAYAAEAPRAPAPRSAAADYLAGLAAGGAPPDTAPPPPPAGSPKGGLRALEDALPRGGPRAARPPRADEWLRVAVTPDVELSVRGPLDPESRARVERCAELLRNVLTGNAP